MRHPATILLSLLAAGGLAACGSSTAPGVVQAPSGGATAAAASPVTTPTSTTPTTTTAQASTPKSGPLAKKPVITVPSGPAPKTLVVHDLVKGIGTAATSGRNIVVNYVGALYKGGKEFDSSWSRNQTFSTPLSNGSVIPGWVQGIAGMKVGGRRELIIPPKLAYGAAGSGSSIPPNSTLVFVVDLLAVS